MALKPRFNFSERIEQAFLDHAGDICAFTKELKDSVQEGLPEKLLRAVQDFLEIETDYLKKAWLRLLTGSILVLKDETDLIGDALEGIPEDDALPDDIRAMALQLIGEMHFARAEFDKAAEKGKAALEYFKVEKSPIAAKILNLLGRCYFRTGDQNTALEYYNRYIDALVEGEDARDRAIAYNNIAIANMSSGNLDEAERAFKSALSIENKVGNRSHIALSLANMSELKTLQNNFKEALLFAENALEFLRVVERKIAVSFALLCKANALLGLGTPGKALEPAEQSLLFAHTCKRKHLIAEAQMVLGTIKSRLQSPDAMEILEKSIATFSELDHSGAPDGLERALYELGRLQCSNSDSDGYGNITRARDILIDRPQTPFVKTMRDDLEKFLSTIPEK